MAWPVVVSDDGWVVCGCLGSGFGVAGLVVVDVHVYVCGGWWVGLGLLLQVSHEPTPVPRLACCDWIPPTAIGGWVVNKGDMGVVWVVIVVLAALVGLGSSFN